VGAPGEDGRGAVYVYHGRRWGLVPYMRITPPATGFTGDEFGFALASSDTMGQGYDDLYVGSPGYSGTGRVLVFKGSANGLSKTPDAYLSSSPVASPASGDRFGATLAVGRPTTYGGDRVAIGAPGRKVGTALIPAGAVFLAKADLTAYVKPYVQLSVPTTVDTLRSGDRFGERLAWGELAASKDNYLAVSAPGVGRVYVYDPTELDSEWLGRAKLKIVGPAGAADGFGAALAIGNFKDSNWGSLAVGAPTRDTFGLTDNGAVRLYDVSGVFQGELTHPSSYAGLGSSLLAVESDGRSYTTLAVGAQYLTVGRVLVYMGTATGMWPLAEFTQGQGEVDEVWDAFGSALVVGRFHGETFFGTDPSYIGFDDIVVGAPGESPGSAPAGSGAAYLFKSVPAGTAQTPRAWSMRSLIAQGD